jgi:signal transduction histidine kinase/ligand-binding sensor domain-containing protein/CheY-like chemotaxis protein
MKSMGMIDFEMKVRWISFLIFCCATVSSFAQSTDELQFVHYTSQDGLPSAYIKDIEQDYFGFIWLANRENVCRFDGYNFNTFPTYDAQGNSINFRPNTLYKVYDSLIFARSISEKFFYFDYNSESFKYYSELNDIGGIEQIVESDSGIWYIKSAQIFHTNLRTMKTFSIAEIFSDGNIGTNPITFFHARGGNLAFVSTNAIGKQQIHFLGEKKHQIFESPLDLIALVYIDSFGNLWISDDQKGLCQINIKSGNFDFYHNQAKGDHQILHNYTHIITEDRDGVLWIGTEGGLCRWSPNGKIISRSEHSLADPHGLSSSPLYSSLCDKDGNIWLGTYFSGVNLWKSRSSFFKTISAGVGEKYLGGNAVSSFVEDHNGDMWIGLEDMGLNHINRANGKVKKYPIGKQNGGLSYGNIHDLYFADASHLWIGTYTGGINILNINTGKFEYLNHENTPELVSNDIYAFTELGDSVFICTTNGINVYHKKTKKFLPFFREIFSNVLIEGVTQTPGKVWFSARNQIYCYDTKKHKMEPFDQLKSLQGINFVKSDSKNRLWIGDSFEGLFCYEIATKKIKQFHNEKGFPGSWIYCMQEGVNDWYWIGTNQGLVKLDPETGTSFLFNKDSGIPFNQFNYRSAFRDSKGVIYLGSNEGLIHFEELNQPLVDRSGHVVLTGFKLFNQPIAPGDDEDVLEKSLTISDKIELEYEQNVFTIEFTALNYLNLGKCHYAYYLEGFETEYNEAGNRNFATYTNLNPGTYTFKVKASFDNTSWEKPPKTLKIIIHPPFWLSKWGFFIYILIAIGILILISLVTTRIQKSKAQAFLERKERLHAIELNQMKLEFFTNISHELRTPLTLIVGPLSKLIANEKVSPYVKEKLAGINLNALRLLQLLNQLLEFRKIEQGKEQLQICEAKISYLFSNLQESFAMTAEENQLIMHFDCEKAQDLVWFDPSKLEKILINLISNSFKFTEANGSIDVTAVLVKNAFDRQKLNITVRDSGKGMEQEVLKKIFTRFYQSDNKRKTEKEYYGTGIGLSFVHSLVELHRGRIWVRSKPNVGTIFKIEIPVSKSDYETSEISDVDYTETLRKNQVIVTQSNRSVVVPAIENGEIDRPLILVVEDNTELMDFIISTLSENYSIINAQNGAEALEKLKGSSVDLILSDVMMPVMDGFELASIAKSDFETSHIPIILLTAKSGPENRYEGLKTGADYYIEKPFLAHILEQNIRNVLTTRRNLVKKFKRDAFMPVTELSHSESDKNFLDKMTKIIKDNIDKPDLDVTFLTSQAGLSRTMLHLKLKKIADCSATEFINTVRLKEAVRLMAELNCNVSEAAYRTGFSSPTYFTRRFKQYFGQSPRDFIQRDNQG